MAIKTVTLEEVRKIPPMSSKEIKELENHVDTDFSDCPVLTKEQLKDATRGYEAHPEWYKPTKSKITIMILNLKARDTRQGLMLFSERKL